jgi:creatinine amidohydrolase
MIRSIAQWGAGGVVIINAHGGNVEVINLVMKEWNYRVRRPKVLGYYAYNPGVMRRIRELFGEFGHADSVETSIIASIRKDLVRVERIRETRRRVDMASARVMELSEEGIMGNLSPSTVDSEKGKALLEYMLEDLVGKFKEFLTRQAHN